VVDVLHRQNAPENAASFSSSRDGADQPLGRPRGRRISCSKPRLGREALVEGEARPADGAHRGLEMCDRRTALAEIGAARAVDMSRTKTATRSAPTERLVAARSRRKPRRRRRAPWRDVA